ncbi:MAG: helix-turn-helix domain-containing protein [Dermatophilaceae bacterium]
MEATQEARAFYSVAETARLLRMSEMTLYRAIRAREFPAVQVRGRLVVPAQAIENLVEAAMSSTVQTQEHPGGVAARRGVAPKASDGERLTQVEGIAGGLA